MNVFKIITSFYFTFALAINKQNKYFRFSYLDDYFFYQSYYTNNVFNCSCAIFQFNAISDYNLLYTLNLLKKNESKIIKGQLNYDYNYDLMNCFILIPNIDNIEELCIQEIDIHNKNYIIFTNKKKEFYYSFIKNQNDLNITYFPLLNYNNTIVKNNNCNYNILPNNKLKNAKNSSRD